MRVSVCIIANQLRGLKKCLDSVVKWGTEIVLVNTNPNIKGLERLAQQYQCSYYTYEWDDDFSAARNFAADQAKYDWIMTLDSDEYLLTGSPLPFFMENDLSQTLGTVARTSFTNDGDARGGHHEVEARLYSRRFFKYQGLVHEQLVPRTARQITVDYRASKIGLGHTGYQNQAVLTAKSYRNEELLKKELATKPKDAYLYYQLGKGYLVRKEYELALAAFKKSLANQAEVMTYSLECLKGLLTTYQALKLNNNLVAAAKAYRSLYEGDGDSFYFIANLFSLAGFYKQAASYYETCLSLNNSQDEAKNASGPKTWLKLADTCSRLKANQQADYCYEQAIKRMDLAALKTTGHAYFKAGQYGQASSFYLAALKLNPTGAELLYLVCQLCLTYIKVKNYEQALKAAVIFKEDLNGYADYLFTLGNIYLAQGKLEAALESYRLTILRGNSQNEGINSWLSYYNQGVIYEYQNKLSLAQQAYNKCQNYEPAKKRLQRLYGQKG